MVRSYTVGDPRPIVEPPDLSELVDGATAEPLDGERIVFCVLGLALVTVVAFGAEMWVRDTRVRADAETQARVAATITGVSLGPICAIART